MVEQELNAQEDKDPKKHTVSQTIARVVLGVLVAAILLVGGYMLGYHPPTTDSTSVSVGVTNTQSLPTITPIISSNGSIGASASALPKSLPTITSSKVVLIGGTSYSGVEPYKSFTTNLLTGWTEQKETIGNGFNVSITNGDYQITISEQAGGIASCIYPGDTQKSQSALFLSPTKVPGYLGSATYDRAEQKGVTTSGSRKYLFCQLKGNVFQMPTDYGYITYTIPQNPSTQLLSEMDTIIEQIH